MELEKEEIYSQINRADQLLDELSSIMTSIQVDVEDLDIQLDELKTSIFDSIRDYSWDINNKHDFTFSDDHEKRKIYFNGVMQGYSLALFWLCDEFGIDDFFDQKIEPFFESSKNKSENDGD